ncbi:hypothetical protein GS501_04590 [Saccharibacter sp. 17.LH.SD]|uniref:hypothetical protein n=1 Tax=Saccharibacter sp. 17.LH.SD TaxID=2689393 RepID=UPI00136FBB4A|nr:hypothetical protein [Saccharibacter sp. 17.LH.SD]MXV44322.1 hypothetical protein [Saccharibacter sp. 17.LH.SD]MXV44323.1 hypothetical protein [Saccharibacter sp. 17.LH.SD]
MSDIRINAQLNLVLPIGEDTIVHSAPLSRDVFDLNWRLFAKTWSLLEGDEIGVTAAPAVAAKALKQADQESGDQEASKASALFAEIKRTANFIRPSQEGYIPVPLASAINKGWIDEDDLDEVLNGLVFFTLASRVLPKQRKSFIFRFLPVLRGAEMTSLNATEFAGSLQKSTTNAPSGETAAA